MRFTVLVIDDEKNIREGLRDNFELEGYAVQTAADGREGLSLIARGGIDAVVTDLRMPKVSGEELLERVTREQPGLPVIVLTAHGSIDGAVAAMSRGAYNFLTKPVDLNQLNLTVRRALENRSLAARHRQLEEQHNRLQKEVLRLQNQADASGAFGRMIGKSAEMQRIFTVIRKAADSKASVLITGENGVGKELVANALHDLSSRRERPFVAVNCAALSETLLESELFGHEKGAFTGAESMVKGRFELADGGTIFLDEIGEINQATQVKLLRVLQERKFERVGGQQSVEIDVRVIAATNRNLEEEIEKGSFREDLYYRLNVVQVHVPALRERKEDIPLLLSQYLAEFAAENGKSISGISNAAKAALYKYDWPGNIRQLRNCIESAVVMCGGTEIGVEDLPANISQSTAADSISIPAGISLASAEKIIIGQTLAANRGNKSRTAEILGIGRKTLHRKLEEYGMDTAE